MFVVKVYIYKLYKTWTTAWRRLYRGDSCARRCITNRLHIRLAIFLFYNFWSKSYLRIYTFFNKSTLFENVYLDTFSLKSHKNLFFTLIIHAVIKCFWNTKHSITQTHQFYLKAPIHQPTRRSTRKFFSPTCRIVNSA